MDEFEKAMTIWAGAIYGSDVRSASMDATIILNGKVTREKRMVKKKFWVSKAKRRTRRYF